MKEESNFAEEQSQRVQADDKEARAAKMREDNLHNMLRGPLVSRKPKNNWFLH